MKTFNHSIKGLLLFSILASILETGAGSVFAEAQKQQLTITRTCEAARPPAPYKDEEPPPDLVEADKLNEEVQKSVGLPEEDKKELAGDFASIQAGFKAVWEPLKEAEASFKRKKDEWKVFFEGRRRVFLQPPKTFIIPDQQAAADAEERAIAEFNNENLKFAERAEAEITENFKALLARKAALNVWTRSGAIDKFLTKTRLSLHKFKEGLAYKQLKSAEASKGNTGIVIDGSVVDGRGSSILSPTERLQLLQAPNRQLPRGFRVTPNSAPPPPSR